MKLITYCFEHVQHVGVLTQDETAVMPLDYPDMNTLIETASPVDLRSAAARWRCLTWSCWPPSPAPGRTFCAWA